MSKEKNKGLVVLVIILSLLVVGLSSYLIYDKVFREDVNKNKDVINNNSNKEDNNILDNSDKIDNIAFDNVYPSEKINFSNLTEIDINSLKNYDDTYPNTKSLYFEYYTSYDKSQAQKTDYKISLSLDEKVIVYNYNTGNRKELELSNVVDIKYFGGEANFTYSLYMLTDNGDVYYYNLSDLENENFEIEKLNISNIIKIEEISSAPLKDAGGCRHLVAITENGTYIKIDGYCM